MNGTLSFDLLPQQAIWAHSARSRFPALVAQEKVAILTSRGVASFSTSIMDKSPRDSTALFIFFSHFSVPSTQCILFEIFCSSPSPHPTRKQFGIHSSNINCLRGEGRGWTCVHWKTPQERESVPRLLSIIV